MILLSSYYRGSLHEAYETSSVPFRRPGVKTPAVTSASIIASTRSQLTDLLLQRNKSI